MAREDVEVVAPFLVLPKLQRATPRRRSVADVGGDIISWFKADQVGAPLTTGQFLGRWPDAIGGDPALPVATAPTWLTGQQNGLPAVLFNATAMSIDPNNGAAVLPTDAWTAAWVSSRIAGVTNPIWSHFAVDTSGGIIRGPLVDVAGTTITVSMYGNGDSGATRIISAFVAGLTLNAWHAGVATYDGTARPGIQSFRLWLDGISQVLSAGDTALPLEIAKTPVVAHSAIGGVLLQAPNTFNQGGNFALGELIIARRQFSGPEALQLSAYLKARWGTP